jgi:hypothetical protein
MDLIGRDEPMRWPEALAIVNQIWARLPDRPKWDQRRLGVALIAITLQPSCRRSLLY